jgi:hypothetical protein
VNRPALLAAAGVALGGCAGPAPLSRPTPDGTGRVYEVAALRFEAPRSWRAEGDSRRVKLTAPAGDATLEVRATAVPGPVDACLEGASRALEKGVAGLTGVRRHPTSFAGQKAVAQEADQGGWHGWAWATCDGGEQYRVFLAGRAPVGKETIDAQRRLVSTARMEGKP